MSSGAVSSCAPGIAVRRPSGQGVALCPQALSRGTRRLVVEAAPLQESAQPLAELVLVAPCEEAQPLEAGLVGALVLSLVLLVEHLVDASLVNALGAQLGLQGARATRAEGAAVLHPVARKGLVVDQAGAVQPLHRRRQGRFVGAAATQ